MIIPHLLTVQGKKCRLVQYSRDLVETYHRWFVEDAELLELTCSELLSLEEEYVNQQSWIEDPDKLTYLIRDETRDDALLCGDINAFFSDYFESDWQTGDPEPSMVPTGRVAEINLMIAEKQSRRKGIAEEALALFMRAIEENTAGTRLFVAKIQLQNTASIKLFEKIGFHEFKRIECFNEVHFIKWVSHNSSRI